MIKSDRKLRIFSALEVAKICGVVNQTAINWIRSGHLKAFTTPGGQYRVYVEDLLVFLDKRNMKIPIEVTQILKNEVEWSKLLIIDDDRIENNMLKRWISKKLPKYKILQAFDSFEAGKEIISSRPGFILLNINLTGIDGYTLCRKIKEDPSLGKPFVIIIGIEILEGKQENPDDWSDASLTKPLNLNSLTSIISSLEEQIDPQV